MDILGVDRWDVMSEFRRDLRDEYYYLKVVLHYLLNCGYTD